MAISPLTYITNNTHQTIPIIVNRIALVLADPLSTVEPLAHGELMLHPGAHMNIETSRLNEGQLHKLMELGLVHSDGRLPNVVGTQIIPLEVSSGGLEAYSTSRISPIYVSRYVTR